MQIVLPPILFDPGRLLTRGQVTTVYGLLFVLIGGHVFDSITHTDHWPFSNYPMFESVADKRLITYRLTCLYTDSTGHPREIYFNPAWVPSLPQFKFVGSLRHNLDGKHPNPAKLRQILSDYLDTYDACRAAGLSHGPDVTAVRLYRLDIPMETPLRQVDLDHHFSDYAQMAFQVDHVQVHPATRPFHLPAVAS